MSRLRIIVDGRTGRRESYLRDVIGDAIASRPLRNELHGEAEKEALSVPWNCDDFLDDGPGRYLLQLLLFYLTLAENFFVFFCNAKIGGSRITLAETRQSRYGFLRAVFGGQPAWCVGEEERGDESESYWDERDGLDKAVLCPCWGHVLASAVVDKET